MNQIYRTMRNLLASILLSLACTITSYAQSTISGKVTDSDGGVLIGANVVIEGTTKGAQSDLEGNFSIENVEAGTYTLVASYIGYGSQNQEITVAAEPLTVNFVLQSDQLGLDEVIVTGVFNEKSKLESSVAITTMNPSVINQRLPRGAGDLLNGVPGTYVDNAGGEVGNRVYARGMASGTTDNTGFRYISLQEDGLPIMSSLVQFATPDMFSRVDITIARMEAIRGGSSAVTANNAPGGIYNMISQEGGSKFGGMAILRSGLTGNNNLYSRFDLGIGGPISSSGFNYYLGGFYRFDEGARDIPFNANVGGQLKGNLTYNYDKGKIKVYGKYLNDKVIHYRPLPFSSLETLEPFEDALVNFDLNTSSTFSDINTQIPDYSFGKDGQTRNFNTSNGINLNLISAGLQLEHDIDDNWTVNFNGKYTNADQRYLQFIGNIVAPVDTALASLGLGAFQDFSSFTDAATGELLYLKAVGDKSKIGNNIFASIPLDMNNDIEDYMHQATLSGKAGSHSITFGTFFSSSRLKSTWHADVMLGTFEPNSRPIVVTHPNPYSIFIPGLPDLQITDENGFIAYNQVTMLGFEGLSTSAAFFANDLWEVNDKLNLDMGLRFESLQQKGFKRGWNTVNTPDAIGGAFPIGPDGDYTTLYDAATRVHNDQVFTYNELYNMWSFSVGANYKINKKTAAFARLSKGNKAPDHEQYISNFENTPIQRGVVEKVYQAELGFKLRQRNFSLFATAFYSYLDDITFRIFAVSTNTTFFTNPTFNKARTMGLEIEAIATPVKGLDFRFTGTLQDPRYIEFAFYNVNGTSPRFDTNGDVLQPLLPIGTPITFPSTPPAPNPGGTVSDDYYEDMSGNQVNDIPKILLDFTTSYTKEKFNIFANVRYTGKYQYNKRNAFELPAFTVLNAGASYQFFDRFNVAIAVNNITNTIGVTRTEGAALLSGNKEFFTKAFLDEHRVNSYGTGLPGSVWAVPILPRLMTATLTFEF